MFATLYYLTCGKTLTISHLITIAINILNAALHLMVPLLYLKIGTCLNCFVTDLNLFLMRKYYEKRINSNPIFLLYYVRK